MISWVRGTLSLISLPGADALYKGESILFKRDFTLLANILVIVL